MAPKAACLRTRSVLPAGLGVAQLSSLRTNRPILTSGVIPRSTLLTPPAPIDQSYLTARPPACPARDNPELPVNPRDPWASREFLIKWARYSYLHLSWETKETLSKVGGAG